MEERCKRKWERKCERCEIRKRKIQGLKPKGKKYEEKEGKWKVRGVNKELKKGERTRRKE